MKILAIVGGISKNSINKKLFELIKPLAPQDFEFSTFDIAGLPFFSQDLEDSLPETVANFRQQIINSNAVLFITPEYNRQIPGVLKNAIDWASRPTGKGAWMGKYAAILGASPGAIGAFGAQMQLKQLLSFLNMKVMWQPEIYFNFSANVKDGAMEDLSKKYFEKFLSAFKAFIEKNA
ncbi:NADPH-dependent FMN reductase [Endomicrobium proavitum]|uniref:FMN reductase, NADPH-dependent n=1 Tax=Endomicrobium proavitum TaxID=1408281 RepID=A0A0G3WJY4_9BACT|nr:NAD(P)H-dependent oxidoreductase [Endomicrobium proavitum]AKL98618.1 FMN reductase, NADPH-dependent [Endomicrobium proavitum]